MLPVYHEKKYDSVYNNPRRRCKHSWFEFQSQVDFKRFGFSSLGIDTVKHRICEKCFIWESDYAKETTGNPWEFMGFGKEAFKRLTQEKINALLNNYFR